MNERSVLDATQRWVVDLVIGLNLCPFARRVVDAGRVRFVATDAADKKTLHTALTQELESLAAAPRTVVETTLLVHPNVLLDFLDYQDFLYAAEPLIEDLGLRGVIQIAGFHPQYQFAGTAQDAVENYTNRSPYPMLHLLREVSISDVATDPDQLLDIPQRNVEMLKKLGRRELLARLKAMTE